MSAQRRPAPPAGSSRPDPRPGRSRPRLSFLVPCFALLLGALGLFGAAPAQAQTYWSATLTVGTVPHGVGCSGSTGAPPCSSQLTEDGFTIGGTEISFFRIRDFHDPKQDRLEISFDQQIQSPPQDLKFCIGTTAYDFPDTAFREHAWNGDVGWSAGDTVSLSIATSCLQPPGAPTGLDVQAGNRRLGLAWTAPSGTVTGYDVHYTSSASVGQNAPASGSDPSAGWVDAGHTGTTATDFILGLTNGTPYRVRVRALNVHGAGDWLRGTGTPTADAVAIHTVALSVSPNPVREGASVTVTATLSSVLTLAGEIRVPLTITDGTAEPGDHGSVAEIRIQRNRHRGSATITTAHDADSDDETFTVAIDTDSLAPALAAGSPSSVEIEIRDDEGSSPLPALVSQACPASGRVWSATMTTGEVTASNAAKFFGYLRSHPSLSDIGTLTRSRFAYRNAAVYGIERIFRIVSSNPDSNGSLTVHLDRALTDGVAETLALHAGGKVFRFADAIRDADSRTLTWRDSGLDWLRNKQVGLCLTDTVVTLSYNDPVYEGQELRLTATVPHPLKSAVTIPVHITDSLTYQETTLDDGFPGITIPADAASGTGTILMPHDEDTVTESYRVRLNNIPAPLVADDPNPLYVIVYDDDEPVPPAEATLRALRNPVAEGKRVQLRLELSHALDADATIPLVVSRGASEDGDHGTLENIEVPAGDVFVYAHIGTKVDGDADDETFTVALDAANLPDGVKAGDPASVEVTITDDGEAREPPAGTPTVSLYAWPNPVAEGSTVRVRARVSSPLADDVTIPVTVTRGTSEAGDHGTLSSITIPFGFLEAIGEITTTVDADTDDETFTVALDTANLPAGVAAGERSVFGGPSETVTIAEDGASGQQQQVDGLGARAEGAVAVHRYAALIAQMYEWREDPQWRHRRSHTSRWDRALLAFGEAVSDATLTPMTAAEAQALADSGLTRWVEVAKALRVIEGGRPYAALIAQMYEWREDPQWRHRRSHTSRWDRALLAFGEPVADATLTAMTAAEAQALADGGLTRWVEVAKALRQIEGGGVQAAAPPVVTIAAGSAVIEGALAGFTLTAAPAPAADLDVTVTVGQEGVFVHSSTLGAHTVTIPAGGTSATLELLTVDDAADEPDGSVTATLGSGSGYTLGNAARASVAVADNDESLPGIVTKRAIAREGSDEAMVFTVRLDRAASGRVTVDYATADGAGRWASTAPATAGADYTATSGTLAFAAGETSKTVSVPILDDAVDEGTEYFLLRFSNPRGATLAAGERETQGLIRNSDPLQRMWLGRFGRTVSGQVLDAVSARIGGSAAPGVVLGGQSLGGGEAAESRLAEAFLRERDARLGRGEEMPASPVREVSMRDLLLASSFHMVSANGGAASTGNWSLWGRGARSSFEGAGGDLSLEGDVTTGTLGFDYERARWLVGVALSRSSGDGSYKAGGTCDTGCAGSVESTLTGVWPYARYRVSDALSVWGALGFGQGEMTLTPEGASPMDADIEMGMAAGGARGVLLPARGPGGFELALRADLLLTDTRSDEAAGLAETGAETSRVRLVLEGSRSLRFADAVLTPSVEIGFRNDSGDAETGSGLEVGGGVRWASGALTTEVSVRGLLAHSESGYEEWGVSASVGYAPGPEGRGLSLRAGSSWGAAQGGVERLWSQAAGLPGGRAEPGARLDAELAWGFDVPRALLTPYAGVSLAEGGETWRAGARWKLGAAAEVNLEANLTERANEGPGGGVLLRGSKRW